MRDDGQQAIGVPVLKLAVIGFALVLGLKLHLGSVLDLYSDEVFYWLASENPAIAYSDLPFMTALLVGIGSNLDPGNAFTVRLPFLILGSCIPFLVYWVALPVTDRQQAFESAALSLCLPLGGFLGLLAVPDVPLLFLGMLSIGFFERAIRTNKMVYWLATGMFVSLGFSTHYRFFLYPLAAVLFLGFYKPARGTWLNPRFWLSAFIASIGLIPLVWFNLNNELSNAIFYLVNRHPWEFQLTGLLHLFKQAVLVTPPLYVAFAIALWVLYKRAKHQDNVAAMLLSFSATNILVYLVLAPWTDATSTSIHWPLSGYFPLLIVLPSVLRQCYHWSRSRWNRVIARRLVICIPMLGFTGTIIALIGVGSQAYQSPLQSLLGSGVLSNKMAGWKPFTAHTAQLIKQRFPKEQPIIITDNYYTAAQVEFAGLSNETYTLDRDKAVRDGRIAQLQLWQKDESGLRTVLNRPVLYINEDSTLTLPDKHDLLGIMCQYVNSIELADELILFNGDKRFSYYLADRIIDRQSRPDFRSFPCPYPPRAWIDYPEAGAELSSTVDIRGWAYNEDIGVQAVYLIIDDQRIGRARYSIRREDVVDAMGVQSDPNAPILGYSYRLDTTSFSNGYHQLAIEIENLQGTSYREGERVVRIRN